MEGRVAWDVPSEYQYCYNGVDFDADGSLFYAGYGYKDKVQSNYDCFVAKFSSGIPAIVSMEPNSLNLDSNGNWVSFKVDSFPENPEYGPLDVDPTSCAIGGVGADLKFGTANNNHFIGKADRLMVEDAIGAPGEDVEVEISGKAAGKSFKGSAIIKAILN
jgi:hypothetical protein